MTTAKPKSKTPGILILILVAAGLYLAYIVVVFLIKCMIYSGYNFLFFTDNLFQIKTFNPIVSWAIAGLFLGSIAGVLVAIKRFKLSKLLVLFPVALVLVFVAIMYFVNHPANYNGDFSSLLPKSGNQNEYIQHFDYYKATMAVNVRTGPSVKYPKAFVLNRGNEVQLIEKNIWDSRHNEWFKIKYNYNEGYINSKYLSFSRSE